MIGSYVTGRIMDRDYRDVKERYRRQHHLGPDVKVDHYHYEDFPVEHARLRSVWWVALLSCVGVLLYGWLLRFPIAVPLVLQFLSKSTRTAPCVNPIRHDPALSLAVR